MKAKREYRDREEVEVAVLDALVDRNGEGMTVFELRSHVEADIDELEAALASLKEDGLIDANTGDRRTLITPDERVVPDPDEQGEGDPSFVDRIIDRLPL
ncbi:MarR family transcriptional regulator [Halobacteriales archaeon QS_1_67_19]|nr:MAG: MarR family transcriptional regulator [Halobacteriales archaeon QS_1_67_19]